LCALCKQPGGSLKAAAGKKTPNLTEASSTEAENGEDADDDWYVLSLLKLILASLLWHVHVVVQELAFSIPSCRGKRAFVGAYWLCLFLPSHWSSSRGE
jgi:hypothetical protein